MIDATQKPVRVAEGNLRELADKVQVPRYSRRNLTVSLVHIGVGGFHRAHQAVYLDELLNAGETDWAECGVGLLPQDARMKQALAQQDCLYTVLTRGNEQTSARIIGSITRYVHGVEEPEAALERLSAPETRIASLTITEGGYYIDEGSGKFQDAHPTVVHDLENPSRPRGVLGYLAAGLDRRRRLGLAPFTVLSCDNLPGNGRVSRYALLSFAELLDPKLRAWIEQNVAFPNSMVDGITPVTTDADRALLSEKFHVEDAWPVVTEPFRQWIIEDHFSNGRPPWESAGAQFTSDVSGYELMKLRLLNAGHSALGYLGLLRGFQHVHEAATDPVFQAFLRRFFEQVLPLIPSLPGIELGDYCRTLIRRFSNAAIRDQLSRICSEGSSKLPKFILPSIRDLARAGRPYSRLSLVVAAWVLYLQESEVIDARREELTKIAKSAGDDPTPLLKVASIFGDLSSNAHFVEEIAGFVKRLRKDGVMAVIRT
jgi:mannitol 2-dehydrogenase